MCLRFVHAIILALIQCISVLPDSTAFTHPSSLRAGNVQHHDTLPSLDTAGIEDLQALLNARIISSVELVTAYLQRMKEVNDVLHAIGEINPDALRIARTRDEERSSKNIRGILHGIPILIKDNIATCDLLNTTAGSEALIGAVPEREATVVSKLRDAGAIILGKTTMGEWAQFRSRANSSSHGWSALGGQASGAYYPRQDPHGSSSGSAVAVSVGLAPVALSTETSGSIVNPAETNNLVGIKPSVGLTSRSMVIPISIRQDSIGPVAHTVKDAAHVLTIMAGKDPRDNYTLAQPFIEPPDYAKACRYSALKGARIGIPRNGIEYFQTPQNDAIMTTFEKSLNILRSAGASVVDNANFEYFDLPALSRNSSIVLDSDFVSGLSHYLQKLVHNPSGIRNLHDLAKFTMNTSSESYPDRDIYVWERALSRNFSSDSDVSRAAYQANLDMAETRGIQGALDRNGLDALIMPTFSSFHLPAVAGLPIVTVPLGFLPAKTPVVLNQKGTMVTSAPGIPFGLSFVGRRWSEETLIGLAYAFEQRTQVRKSRAPFISPITELKPSVVSPPKQVSPPDGTAVQRSVQYVMKFARRSVKGLLELRGLSTQLKLMEQVT